MTDWWQLPAFVLTIMTILAFLYKMSRSYNRLESKLEEHSRLLKKCDGHTYVTEDDCEKEQRDCRNQQNAENEKILKAIQKIAERFEENIIRLHNKAEERQQINHDELMKMNKALGRIEGVVGRHRFADE